MEIVVKIIEMTNMENCPLRCSSVRQLYPENMSEAKSTFLHSGSSSVCRAEVICPKPRRASGVPYMLDSPSRLGPKSKGTLPVGRGNHGQGFLDVILTKDEIEGGSDASNQVGFLCGSPPVRTNNPVVHDTEFAKLTLPSASPLGNCHGMKPPRHDKGSPTCGSPLGASPMVRIEGFSCGSPESRCFIPTLA